MPSESAGKIQGVLLSTYHWHWHTLAFSLTPADHDVQVEGASSVVAIVLRGSFKLKAKLLVIQR